MVTPRRGAGFTLLEVLIAFVVLEVGLLGAVGVLVLASGSLSRAALLERAFAEAAQVADSLSRRGGAPSGEVVRDGWRVRWETDAGGLIRVTAAPPGQEGGEALAEVVVP